MKIIAALVMLSTAGFTQQSVQLEKLMSKPVIGKLITGPSANRDAIHVPIIEVTAGQNTSPGSKVYLTKSNSVFFAWESKNYLVPSKAFVGVVDPFLLEPVLCGDRFYCWLRPNSTKKLWHDWTHKDIDL